MIWFDDLVAYFLIIMAVLVSFLGKYFDYKKEMKLIEKRVYPSQSSKGNFTKRDLEVFRDHDKWLILFACLLVGIGVGITLGKLFSFLSLSGSVGVFLGLSLFLYYYISS